MNYSEMVNQLFKKEGMHQEHEAIMHAAIGIVGEVGELVEAISSDDDENVIEEFGDMEFYQIAAAQICGMYDVQMDNVAPAEGKIVSMLIKVGCDLLDIAKKSWAYGKPLDQEAFADALINFRRYYYASAAAYGLTIEQIREHNQNKLANRYPGLVYSDKDAQERKDKQ